MIFVDRFCQMICKNRKRKKDIPYKNDKLPYATQNDVIRCIEIVRKELCNKNIVVTEDILREITEDIMGISYAKGGGYSSDIIQSFARTYVGYGMYKKIIEK